MTRTVSITLEDNILEYIDEVAKLNQRSRSNTIAWLIKMEMAKDAALEEEAKEHDKV